MEQWFQSSVSLSMAPHKVTLHTILPAGILATLIALALRRYVKKMMIDCYRFALFDSCC
jgi:hypothetical protein